MRILMLPGDSGFNEWLSIPPPDWRGHVEAQEGRGFYAVDQSSGLMFPVSPRALDELVFDAGLYLDESDVL